MNLILASKSERRSSLLKKLKIDFNIQDSKLDESKISIKNPSKYCQILANMKAEIILNKNQNSIVIGADTIVEINQNILEKPNNYDEAYKMLKKLSGKTHSVFTGVSILSTSKKINFVEQTKVTFFKLNDNEIEKYILENKPFDKSGSYGIQDDSMLFVKSIKGNYENVIGLPLSKVYRYLLEFKVIK